jgi:hypothetical protein
LAANGFVFRDLGLAADESDRAMLRIREELGRLAQAFQRAQPHHRTLIAALEEVALNELLYRPPRHIVSLEFAPHLGLGYSFALPYSHIPFLRLTLGLSIRGVSTLFSSADNEFGVAPTLGLEFEPVRLSGSVVRGRLGLRAGYGWNTEDGFGDRPCSERDQAQLHCSRMFVDSYGLITLVDIVRAAVGVTYAPPAGRFSTGEFGFWASVGLQWRSSR